MVQLGICSKKIIIEDLEMSETLGIIARAVIVNKTRDKILLVKNKDGDFWYPPGGNWEPEKESIKECAVREAKEETGLDVKLLLFMYAQEFRNEKRGKAMIELFWLCEAEGKEINGHIDQDSNGQVELAQWFEKEDLQDKVVFPEVLKNRFWEEVDEVLNKEDKFLKI